MTLLLAANFDEASGNVLDYGTAGSWTLAGSDVIRVDDGHTARAIQDNGTTRATPPNVGQTNNRTFMFWMKGVIPSLDWIVQYYQASGDTSHWGLLVQGGNLRVRGRNGGGTVVAADIPIPGDLTSTYHHIAGTFDGTNIKAYLDGALTATSALSGTLQTDGVLFLMGNAVSTRIDDLRIYDEALDAVTIAALMSTPVGASGTPEGSVWNGSAWISSSMRYWNGSAWSAS